MDGISIGKLARAARVSVDTVRLYERKGLLAAALRSNGGQRRYAWADLQQLKLIRRAQAVGFSLSEIADLLGNTVRPQGRLESLFKGRLAAIEKTIRELETWRDALRSLLNNGDGDSNLRSLPRSLAVTEDVSALVRVSH